ncbi:MAG: hypothetical protein ACOZDY_13910 [Pseudomonadota bacterium]
MHRSKNLYRRIAELPLARHEREHALRNLQTAEGFIDSVEAAVNFVRQTIRALEQFGRGLYRQHKTS